ncbi:MAG: type II secretion system protein, partial [Pseudomonadota bacterium]
YQLEFKILPEMLLKILYKMLNLLSIRTYYKYFCQYCHGYSKKNRFGFTLLEMSISLIIITALIISVFVGYSIRDEMKLNAIIADYNIINKAVQDFKLQYNNSLPGDIWNAVDYLGGGVTNGNGNRLIDNDEHLLFWNHLSTAGYLENIYDGSTNEPGLGVYAGPLRYSGFYVDTDASGDLKVGIAIYNDADSDGTIERIDSEDRVALLEPQEAYYIDNAYDDGLPQNGYITATNGSNNSGECVDTGGSNDVYNLDNENVACIIELLIE